MPAVAKTSRAAWVQAGLDVLARGGVDAVRVEVVAAGLGVTKGGFYGTFAGRDAFLVALLEEWEGRATDQVLAQVEVEGGDPQARMVRAGQLTFAPDLLPVDLAVRSWALRDAAVAERLRRVDNVRIGFLREMFTLLLDDPDEIEARSTAAFAIAIGEHFMATDHPGRTRDEAIALTVERMIFRKLTPDP